MEVISVIVMFIFGNMDDQEHRLTQYVPMESLSSCMKEVRLLKKKETDYTKDAFCGPALVEINNDGEILTLHNALPEGAKMVRKKISKEAFERWALRAKEKWNNK
jgi:predicted secreted protein